MLHIIKKTNTAATQTHCAAVIPNIPFFGKNGMFKGVMLLFLAVLFFPHSAQAMPGVSGGGSGTAASPYTINNATDFATLRSLIVANQNQGSYWKMTANINLGNTEYTPVGTNYEFYGVFDGGGYTLTCGYMTSTTEDYRGVFGKTYNATIQNLNVNFSYFNGNSYTGGLVGQAHGHFSAYNVHIKSDGISKRYGHYTGGFIGRADTQAGRTINIEFCSVDYAQIDLRDVANEDDWWAFGGFIGEIVPSYTVTLKDCFARVGTLRLIKIDNTVGDCGDRGLGGLIGINYNNVNIIRCVAAVNIPNMADRWRGQMIGYQRNEKTAFFYASYQTFAGTAVGLGLSSGTVSLATWGDHEYERMHIERRNDSGNDIASNIRGNERWGVYTYTYPKLTNTNYSIRIAQGSNISSVSGSGHNVGGYFRAANTEVTVTSSLSPTSHQKVQYAFAAAYNHSAYNATSNPNYTASTSGNNWLLTVKTDGTVSSSLINIPYPYWTSADNEINAELLPLDNKITVKWKYNNPDNLTGKFYVYFKENSASSWTKLTATGLTLANGNNQTMTYDITTANFQFNKAYSIYVGYVEGTAPTLPTDITAANRASIDNFSTTADMGNWTVNATGGLNKITVTLGGGLINTNLVASLGYSYKIQRSINGGAYEDWLTENFSGKTDYSHDNTGVTVICDAYRYKVIISAFGATYEKESGEAHSTGSTSFLTAETSFKASKGEFSNYVRLQWKVNRTTGGSDDTYKVFRRTANTTEEWSEMETVTSNAGNVYWNDNNALTGVFYEYKVVLYQNCSSTLTQLAEKTDIGFTQAFGTVSGRVTYGTGGNAVKDANMLVRKNALQQGENQYYSLKSTGGGQKVEWKADQTYFNNIWTAKNWTTQFWLNPDNDNTANSVFANIGNIQLKLQPTTGGYKIAAEKISTSMRDAIAGTGTETTYNVPYDTYYKYSYSQQIYLASELGATSGGTINSISFQYIYTIPITNTAVKLYLGNTAKNEFASTTDWVALNDLTEVYDGTVVFNNTGANYWVTINFTTPFIYTGGNIVVAFDSNLGTHSTNNNPTFRYSSKTNQVLYYHNDFSNPDPAAPPTAIDLTSTRANAKFNISTEEIVVTPIFASNAVIPANQFSHIAVTRSGNDFKIHTVNDSNPDSIYIQTSAVVYTDADASANYAKISFGDALKGYIDDVRFWNKALTESEIKRDYSRVLVGNESGLKGYWTFDENLAGYAFDRSRAGTVYNSNHATTNSLASSALVPDDTYQLALKGITDHNGNYQISGIAYQGEGTSYSIVPSLGSDNGIIDGRHQFNPTEQLRYISPSSMVHNATDFTDISSFMLRGKVVYEGGNYPVSDCQLEIDGQPVTLPNGTVVKSDNVGEFEINIPIGSHSVRVVKQGHTFANGGYLKDANGIDFVWNAPKAGIVFNDQTKVKLIGRVVGGNTEGSKPLGFGETVNNIGVQTVVLNSTRQAYNFSNAPVSATYNHNNGQWHKPTGLTDDQTTVDYNQKNVTVRVSPTTGEFSAMVYPEPYDIQPISVTRGAGQTALLIKENAENIDLTPTAVPDASYLQTEIRTWKDSAYVANRPGMVDHWEYSEKSDTVRYNSKWTVTYQAAPTFGVTQIVNDAAVDYFGELTYEVKDEIAGTNDTIDLYNSTNDTYLFGKPVFQQGKQYNLRFNAYEEYKNFVSDPVVTVTYPVSSGVIDMTNNLQVTVQTEGLPMDENGIYNYRFTAGAPNLTTATASINATLSLGAGNYLWNLGNDALEAWQLGEKSTGTNFMTLGPDQLTAILRDPPGTASHAYIEKGTTISSTSTTSVGSTTATELNLTTSLGPKVTAFFGLGVGVITESEVKLDASVGLSTEQTYSNETEETTTTTFTERFETSSSPDYVGAMGDVFIGNSTNILYGLTNGVKIQKGVTAGTTYNTQGDYKIASSAAIAYGQNFATRFAFTAYELEEIMIPKWKNSIASRLQPVGTQVNTATISAPVYVSKLATTDANYGKWNLDEVFKTNPAYSATSPYDGASYKIYFPTGGEQAQESSTTVNVGGNDMTVTSAFVDSILWANNQIETWTAVLAQNEKEKVEMVNKGNYSFGGGASIEYSEASTASSAYTHNFGFTITPSLGATVGGEVMGIGMELETSVSVAVETGGSTGGSTETSKTTGFVLAEEGDDDEITVDYGMTAGGTFAFKTRGGQTSCPYEGEILSKYYEPGQHILQEATMRIEVPVINVSSASQVINVPANRTANFTLALQNESEINEDVWFQLIVDEETNPNGAELKIDGIGIGNGRTFLVKAGETLTKTLTLGKGTVDDYDNIGLILRSMCQADPTGAWEVIADTTWVSAHFVPACSEVAISQPANNFIVNTESPNGRVLSVTLQNFDVNFPNFGYIRLEYRPAGTPTWLTARTFYPTALFANSTDGTKENIGNRAVIVYDWTMPTADGQYELRATTASVNIVNNAIVGNPLSTYSTTAITGYKDMVKPVAMGAPSPADGIYGAGDELSVTFNEDINTSMIIADNITVTYGASHTLVPITTNNIIASSNKITFSYPIDYFSILEGQTLDIKVEDIYDMHGNKSDPTIWTAYVNRNALVWETAEVNLTKQAGETLTFTAKIKNAGSATVSYSFNDNNLNMHLPQWLSVNQPTGTLQPLTSKELTFTVSSGVNLGTYAEQIGVTSGNLIAKNLPLNLLVTGMLPEGWAVNPADYESTMTVTGRIQIEGVYQTDAADILAAFIGDECVGITSPIKPLETSNEYYTFLTVYGNAAHAGQAIQFKIWDASSGNVYSVIESKIGGVTQNFTFSANTIKGTVVNPVIHNALNMIEQSIALNNGWNWISVNVLNTNPTILQQFKDRIATAGEMLKGQNGYIQNPSWAGTLSSIEKEQMYLVKTNAATTLHFDGSPADAASSPITLANGWNWIGYIPQFTLPVNEALADLVAQNNDQIKGHNAYRVYAGVDVGWVGNLNYMRAGEGYMYNSYATAGKTFNYPNVGSQVYHAPMRITEQTVENRWTVDTYKYPNTMTMTSVVLANSVELQSDQIEIAAFDANGECRGSALLQNVPQNSEHPYLGFLMVFGENSENLTLKVYDHAIGTEYTASNVVYFVTDAIHGTPAEPYRIQLENTGINEISVEQVAIYPNPVVDVLNIASGNLRIKDVKIIDAFGRIVMIDNVLESSTINVSNLTSGIYSIQITTSEGIVTSKFVKK